MINPENVRVQSNNSESDNSIHNKAIAILKDSNLKLRQSQQNTIDSNMIESKGQAEIKISNESIIQENSLKNNLTPAKITLSNPIKIGDLSIRLKDYFNSNTWNLGTGTVQFKNEDSINTISQGLTPLMVLILSHEFELAEELLSYPGIDLTITAIITTLSMNHFNGKNALDFLLFLRFQPNLRWPGKEFSIIHERLIQKIVSKHPELIYRLYEQDGSRTSPITMTISWQDLACVKLLLQNGKFLNLIHDGHYDLISAQAIGNFEIALYLLNCGINPVVPSDIQSKGNVLHDIAYVGEREHYSTITALLLCSGLKYNLMDEDGLTALEILSRYPNFEQYPQRIINGIGPDEIESEDQVGRKILKEMLLVIDNFYHSVISNDQKKAKEYLEMNLPVNVRNAAGKSPLHIACENNLQDMISLLTQHGANWLSRDDENQTPFDRSVLKYAVDRDLPSKANGRVMNIIQSVIDKQVFQWMIAFLKSYTRPLKTIDANLSIFIFSTHFQKIFAFAETPEARSFIYQGISKAIDSKQIFLAAKRVATAQKEGIDNRDLDTQRNWLTQYKLRPSIGIEVPISKNNSKIVHI